MKNVKFKIQTDSDAAEYIIDPMPFIPPKDCLLWIESIREILGEENYKTCLERDDKFDQKPHVVSGYELEKKDGEYTLIVKIQN